MSTTQSNMQDKLGGVLRAQPKKTIFLSILLTVLAVMIGRFVLGKGNPSPARALAAKSNNALVTGKKPGDLSNGAKLPAATAAQLKWAEAPVGPVSRNFFTVRSEFFPVDGSRTTQSDATNGGFWSSLEKSLAVQADQRFKHDNLIANYMAQASGLKLQSIVMGPQPTAMVSGQLVGEGSEVAGFRVLKIEARRMIIEREGIRLEIQLK